MNSKEFDYERARRILKSFFNGFLEKYSSGWSCMNYEQVAQISRLLGQLTFSCCIGLISESEHDEYYSCIMALCKS